MAMTDRNALSQAFRDAFRDHPAGVAVISADSADGPVALTVSSLISVSAEPPVVAFSLSDGSRSAAPLQDSETVVIHLLRQQDRALGELCATSGADRFGPGIDWQRLATGEPRYTSVATWFRARRVGVMPLDGATVIAAELVEGEVGPTDEPHATRTLVYLDRRWHRVADVV